MFTNTQFLENAQQLSENVKFQWIPISNQMPLKQSFNGFGSNVINGPPIRSGVLPSSNKKRSIVEEDEEAMEDEIDIVRKRIRTDFKELDEYTIKLILETGCVLWGKGKRYENKLFEGWDNDTIQQYNYYKKNNQKDILDSLCHEKIEKIKTEQFFNFAEHYQNLPKQLKDIINYAYPDFPIELDKIINQAQDATYFGVVLLEIWSDLIGDK